MLGQLHVEVHLRVCLSPHSFCVCACVCTPHADGSLWANAREWRGEQNRVMDLGAQGGSHHATEPPSRAHTMLENF